MGIRDHGHCKYYLRRQDVFMLCYIYIKDLVSSHLLHYLWMHELDLCKIRVPCMI